MARRASEFKVRAYQLFKAGVPLSEIPERIGCSKSLVYRWALREKWSSPLQSSLAPIESAAQKIQSGDEMAGLAELLRSKVPERLAELDAQCKKGNVAALNLWFRLTGTVSKAETEQRDEPAAPSFVMNLHVNGRKPEAEPAVEFIGLAQRSPDNRDNLPELPEAPAEPGFVNDLSEPPPGNRDELADLALVNTDAARNEALLAPINAETATNEGSPVENRLG